MNTRRNRIRVGQALFAAAAILAVGFTSVPAGASSEARTASALRRYVGVTITAHSFNVCSAVCGPVGWHHRDRATARNLVSFYWVGDSAWSVGLQEVCNADRTYLQSNLSGAINPSNYITVKYNVPNCPTDFGSSQSFEVAMFMKGTANPGQSFIRFYDHQSTGYQNCVASATQECRAMVCMKAGTFAGEPPRDR